MTRDYAVDLTRRQAARPAGRAALAPFLKPTTLVPTDGIVKKTALEITRHAPDDLAKARAIYDWIVENTARDVYGIRVAKSALGYQSLGTKTDVITSAQHCRAEVYLSGFGWTPIDPADVRKVVVEEPPGTLSLTDARVASARQRLFGSWEMNWMAYNAGQDVTLPGATIQHVVPFLMYPQAETGGRRVDSLDPAHFTYRITARETT